MNKAKQLILGFFILCVILFGTPILIEKFGERMGDELINMGINKAVIIGSHSDVLFYNKISMHPSIVLSKTFLFNGQKTGHIHIMGTYDVELHSDDLERSNYSIFNFSSHISFL